MISLNQSLKKKIQELENVIKGWENKSSYLEENDNAFKTEKEIMIDLLRKGNLYEYKTKFLEKKQKELAEKLLKMRSTSHI
jgi:DNA phosphorothioation-dependent restriction protein DptG